MAKFQQVTPLRPWPPGRKRAARAAAIYGGGKRRASTTSYSSLNSLRVMDRSRAASKTPLCANSMILDATKRVAGSSLSLRPNSPHFGMPTPRRNDTRPNGPMLARQSWRPLV